MKNENSQRTQKIRKLAVFYILLIIDGFTYFYSPTLYVGLILLASIIFSMFIFSFAQILSDRFQDGFYYYFGLSFLFSSIFEIAILFSLPGFELIRHSSPERLISLSLISSFIILINSLYVLLGKRKVADVSKILIFNSIVSLALVHLTLFYPMIPQYLGTSAFRFDRYFIFQMVLAIQVMICIYLIFTKTDLPFNKTKYEYIAFFISLLFKHESLLKYLYTGSNIIVIFWTFHLICLFFVYLQYTRLTIDDPINTIFSVLKEKEQDLIDEIERRNELEEKLAEAMEKLIIQNTEFQEILDNTGLLIYIKDLEGKYLRANRAFQKIVKLTQEEIIGKTDFDLFPMKEAEIFQINDKQILETRTTIKVLETLTIDGITHTFISVKFPLGIKDEIYGICGISTDITERLRTEEELWKAQKLESLGFLASGIAHDFNNYLMGAQSFLSFIEMEPENQEEVKKNVEIVKSALQKAATLTKQLITFGKGGAPIKKPNNIKNIIKESTEFVMHGKKVKLVYKAMFDCVIEADSNQISQALQNILLNAIQAIEHDYGVIEIGMGYKKVDISNESLSEILPQGEYLKISIKDNGIGIPPEHLTKLFDPYFTTKKDGTGLGLTITYSIIKRHNGHISVESEVDKGTTFYIYLPNSKSELKIEPVKPTQQCTQYSGKVLIMDDETIICKGLSRLLEKIGFNTEITYNGTEAIEKYGIAMEKNEPFDFVILDLTVPGGMGGKECMQAILKIDPKAIGIVSSGYSNDPILSDPKSFGFFEMLEKPYTAQDLYEKAKKIMEFKQKRCSS